MPLEAFDGNTGHLLMTASSATSLGATRCPPSRSLPLRLVNDTSMFGDTGEGGVGVVARWRFAGGPPFVLRERLSADFKMSPMTIDVVQQMCWPGRWLCWVRGHLGDGQRKRSNVLASWPDADTRSLY